MASEHDTFHIVESDTASIVEATPPPSMDEIAIEEETIVEESTARCRWPVLTLHELDELETDEQQAKIKAEKEAIQAEVEALQHKKALRATKKLLNRDQRRLDSLLRKQAQMDLMEMGKVKAEPDSEAVEHEPSAPPKPRNLAVSSLEKNEQQAVTTVLALLTSQIHSLESQNESLVSALENAKTRIAKLEKFHETLVAHVKKEGKDKAAIQARYSVLEKENSEQHETIFQMRDEHDMREAGLAAELRDVQSQLEEMRAEQGEKIAEGICNGLRDLVVGEK